MVMSDDSTRLTGPRRTHPRLRSLCEVEGLLLSVVVVMSNAKAVIKMAEDNQIVVIVFLVVLIFAIFARRLCKDISTAPIDLLE